MIMLLNGTSFCTVTTCTDWAFSPHAPLRSLPVRQQHIILQNDCKNQPTQFSPTNNCYSQGPEYLRCAIHEKFPESENASSYRSLFLRTCTRMELSWSNCGPPGSAFAARSPYALQKNHELHSAITKIYWPMQKFASNCRWHLKIQETKKWKWFKKKHQIQTHKMNPDVIAFEGKT